jgi:hypothetical protein
VIGSISLARSANALRWSTPSGMERPVQEPGHGSSGAAAVSKGRIGWSVEVTMLRTRRPTKAATSPSGDQSRMRWPGRAQRVGALDASFTLLRWRSSAGL